MPLVRERRARDEEERVVVEMEFLGPGTRAPIIRANAALGCLICPVVTKRDG